jgi:hypothetical protein
MGQVHAVFALASTRLYGEIARDDPQPFKQRLAAVAHEWACHRLGTSNSKTLHSARHPPRQ